jgi:crotonobetainyl-CoA hydratase
MTASPFYKFENEGALAIITITRPEVMNSLHPAGHRAMDEAFNRFRDDDSLYVAILTGQGDKSFCAGSDLKTLSNDEDHDKPQTGFGGITNRTDLFKPVIAAINGYCLGGGLEMVAACDLAVASKTAKFGLPETRVGLAATGGGLLQRLPRQVPMKDAMWLILTGATIDADKALSMHLINKVVDPEDVLKSAKEMAHQILECAPLGVQASKQVVLQSLSEPDLEKAINANYEAVNRMMSSKDAIEGPRAFSEKRKPVWLGK